MAGLMAGKRGLIMGVANDHSIAWGIARALRDQGAELAFTYQGAAFERRVRPLAQSVGSDLVMPCDVEQESEVAGVFADLGKAWGNLDFVIHAIAYSDKEELKGRYLNTSRANFRRTLAISCYSFTAVARWKPGAHRRSSRLSRPRRLTASGVDPSGNGAGVVALIGRCFDHASIPS
jgi:enoyl-[acyl-carrier protein] reductase I